MKCKGDNIKAIHAHFIVSYLGLPMFPYSNGLDLAILLFWGN